MRTADDAKVLQLLHDRLEALIRQHGDHSSNMFSLKARKLAAKLRKAIDAAAIKTDDEDERA